jgi:predicted nucleic acid-binding Zn finger protein
MLQSKDIKNIWELKNSFTPKWVEPEFIASSLKLFSFPQLGKSISEIKQKGYSFEWIMTVLLSMPFIGSSTVNSMLNGCVRHHIEAGKDTFYRLKNHSKVCWRLLLWLFASKFKKLVNSKLKQANQGLKCMVFDDTLLEKTGKHIEKVSRVFDHVTRRYVLGFKLLLMGYWDGGSFIPVDFSLHREVGTNKEKPFGLKKKELKKQFQKNREKDTPAYERACEADESKIDSAIKMFKRAISLGFVVDYLLVDSWFTCEAMIDAVLGVKKCAVHLIGMYKIVKTKFLYQDKKLTYNQIRNILGKPKRCRKLKLYYLEAEVMYNEKTIKLFFSKKGVNGKWKVLVCTNTRLSFVEMIEIYQIRWTIEVFFKESKQLLGLGRCQSNDFEAQIAAATITMLQHILLTMKYRIENYESMQGLYSEIGEAAIQQRLDRRLWGLFIEILNIIESLFDGIDEDELIKRIFNDETAREKIARLLNEPEKQNIAA